MVFLGGLFVGCRLYRLCKIAFAYAKFRVHCYFYPFIPISFMLPYFIYLICQIDSAILFSAILFSVWMHGICSFLRTHDCFSHVTGLCTGQTSHISRLLHTIGLHGLWVTTQYVMEQVSQLVYIFFIDIHHC